MRKIGHRGAKAWLDENTIPSIKKAIELGAKEIEIDVHCCKSGELVVIHDETLERTTDGRGLVSDYTLFELQQFKTQEGYTIPTLRQVLDLICSQCVLNIELKGANTAIPTIKLLREYVQKTSWEYQHFVLSSFDHDQLFKVKSATSNFRVGVLTEENISEVLDVAKEVRAYSIHPEVGTLDSDEIDNARGLGYKIYAWTVNTALSINQSKLWNVDAIITDFPNFA